MSLLSLPLSLVRGVCLPKTSALSPSVSPGVSLPPHVSLSLYVSLCLSRYLPACLCLSLSVSVSFCLLTILWAIGASLCLCFSPQRPPLLRILVALPIKRTTPAAAAAAAVAAVPVDAPRGPPRAPIDEKQHRGAPLTDTLNNRPHSYKRASTERASVRSSVSIRAPLSGDPPSWGEGEGRKGQGGAPWGPPRQRRTMKNSP